MAHVLYRSIRFDWLAERTLNRPRIFKHQLYGIAAWRCLPQYVHVWSLVSVCKWQCTCPGRCKWNQHHWELQQSQKFRILRWPMTSHRTDFASYQHIMGMLESTRAASMRSFLGSPAVARQWKCCTCICLDQRALRAWSGLMYGRIPWSGALIVHSCVPHGNV